MVNCVLEIVLIQLKTLNLGSYYWLSIFATLASLPNCYPEIL